MREREQLVEIMACADAAAGGLNFDKFDRFAKGVWRRRSAKVLDAIEAAGFTIVPPDDGR